MNGERLQYLFSSVGDMPERIRFAQIDAGDPDPTRWRIRSPIADVLAPESPGKASSENWHDQGSVPRPASDSYATRACFAMMGTTTCCSAAGEKRGLVWHASSLVERPVNARGAGNARGFLSCLGRAFCKRPGYDSFR